MTIEKKRIDFTYENDIYDTKIFSDENFDKKSDKDTSIEKLNVNSSLWNDILREFEEKTICNLVKKEEENRVLQENITFNSQQSNYLNKEIFSKLLPAMEKMLIKARYHHALYVQKCHFNGIDYLAEILWNSNPRYLKRNLHWKYVFEIPQFKILLLTKPRPIFPKYSYFSMEEAIICIQKYIRGWLVRKCYNIQKIQILLKAKKSNSLLKNLDTKPIHE